MTRTQLARTVGRVVAVLGAAALLTGIGAASAGAAATAGWQSYTLTLPNAKLADVYASGPADVWAVGTVNPVPAETTVLWRFDGSTWRQQAVADVGNAGAIAGVSASDVWIGGRKGFAHHDGRDWTTYPLPAPDNTQVVDLFHGGAGAVWALLQLPVVDGRYDGQRLARFTGAGWEIVVPDAVRDLDAPRLVFAGSGADDLWVSYTTSSASRLLRWNGQSFALVSSTLSFTDLVALSPSDAWGSGTEADPRRWDGQSWTVVGDGDATVSYRPRAAGTGTVWANRLESFDGYWMVSLVRWVDGAWQEVPGGPVGVSTDGVLRYTAAGEKAVVALQYPTIRSNGQNTQVIDIYTN